MSFPIAAEAAAILGLLVGSTVSATAQDSPVSLHVTAHAAVAYTRVNPVPGGRALAETRIEQAVVSAMATALGDHLHLLGTLNLEGLTMPNGVLTLGGWGEGFNERRHPHTYAHELILSGIVGAMRPVAAAMVVGKGFVPFGTDDPMNRPALRFPVNHHWSQILERALLSAGVRAGAAVLEGSIFNGDEPEGPGQWPRISRFGDSWSLRVSLVPRAGVELQGSHAHVASPEHRPGAGTSQEKWSVSGRLERSFPNGTLYALGEWARTDEAGDLRFESWLVETSYTSGPHRPYYRFEHTDRPEEERTLDPFRSLRPHLENSILGVSQWDVHTVGYGFSPRFSAKLQIEPILEVGHASVKETRGGFFNVVTFFGSPSLWSVTVAVRVRSAGAPHRMGRYGVVEPMHHH